MIDPTTVIPKNGYVLVKLEPESLFTREGLEKPKIAAKKVVCKECQGGGCFIRPIYEEDGLKIARHQEVECERCGGAGYRSRAYEVGGEEKERWASVIRVGPGFQRKRIEFATGRVLKWLRGRVTPDLQPGDHVLLSRYASLLYPLDDQEYGYHLVLYDECALALPEDEPVPSVSTLPSH